MGQGTAHVNKPSTKYEVCDRLASCLMPVLRKMARDIGLNDKHNSAQDLQQEGLLAILPALQDLEERLNTSCFERMWSCRLSYVRESPPVPKFTVIRDEHGENGDSESVGKRTQKSPRRYRICEEELSSQDYTEGALFLARFGGAARSLPQVADELAGVLTGFAQRHPKHSLVLRQLWGLGSKSVAGKHREVARHLGVTRQRVGALKDRAIQLLLQEHGPELESIYKRWLDGDEDDIAV